MQYNVHTNKKAANMYEHMGINGEVLQLRAVIKSCIFYCKSRENPYHVLQVTCAVFEHAMKSKVGKIITTVPSYTGKK